jgi:hypothetical protein
MAHAPPPSLVRLTTYQEIEDSNPSSPAGCPRLADQIRDHLNEKSVHLTPSGMFT